jgi:transposase
MVHPHVRKEIVMIKYREILRLRASGVSIRNIAYSCDCSKSTVQHALKKAKMQGLSWPLPEQIDDREIYRILFPKEVSVSDKVEPDFEKINSELLKKGVTLALCWNEYVDLCIEQGGAPYQYSAFCRRYRLWGQAKNAVMHIERKPAETMMVDWAGKTMEVISRDTSETLKVYIFVACLPYSSYLFAEGFYKMDQEAWLSAHINAFEHFGGTTPILIPDNLKTGIVRNGLDDLVVNESYRRLAEYYGTAVVPARVRKPRDKAAVESSVGLITRGAMAPLRNHTFFDLGELNRALKEKVDEINCRPFQKREGSRGSIFSGQEKDALVPLPRKRFEAYTLKTTTVPYNYHISVESIFYSVPFEYVKQEVEVRISKSMIAIYKDAERIASHKRSYAHKGSYVTNPEHMPEAHKDYTEWTGDRFRRWAREKGNAVEEVIDSVLKCKPIEQQAYRSCHAIISLAKKHGDTALDEACIRALAISRIPSYKTVKTIITRMNDTKEGPQDGNEYAFLRGAEYFENETGE